MPVQKIRHRNNNYNNDTEYFSIFSVLLNSKISFNAKGVYMILVNAKEDAIINTKVLSTVSSDSEELIAEGIKELEENKHLKIEGDTYKIFELPYE
ncbi:hypothetical protein [Terrisporobacter sp.]|uniref:hypothetical protein n=1 Tax=Terrisporobacter sp. TaxID=1965305 RepID=UPI00289E8A10|nr:hypothetical protein [Terrisporobacter sp.]